MRTSTCIQYNDNFKPKIELIIGSYAKYLPAPTTTIFWRAKSDNGRPWALTDPKSPASATPVSTNIVIDKVPLIFPEYSKLHYMLL